MKFSVYAQRILRDKVKLAFIILLLVIPLLDIGQILYELYVTPEMSVPDPRYVSFSALYTVGTNHMLHKIMFWFLPIHLLIITGEGALEDHDTGYRNILVSRMSKKQYIWKTAGNAFLFCFLIIFLSLILNYGLAQVIFSEGEYNKNLPNLYPPEEHRLYTIGYYHPILISIVNIVVTAVFSGLIGMVGSALAMGVSDRKIVYGITFMLWFIFILIDDGLMSILHPFTNMTLDRFIAAILLIVCGYSAIALISLAAEVKSDEI